MSGTAETESEGICPGAEKAAAALGRFPAHMLVELTLNTSASLTNLLYPSGACMTDIDSSLIEDRRCSGRTVLSLCNCCPS